MTDARVWGVQEEYHETGGRLIGAPPQTVTAALAALGATDQAEPPPPGALILHRGDSLQGVLEVATEDGRTVVVQGEVDEDLPLGYHTIVGAGAARSLIVSPRRCHLPGDLRLGGWAVQLYSARSAQSWGFGDLTDLRRLGSWAAAGGAGFVLVNPLNAAAPAAPVQDSPYLPTTRRWRSPLYLRVEEVPGAGALGAELAGLAAAGRSLNSERLIDRDAVWSLKLDALARIAATSPPAADFTAWRRSQGDALERFATFSAIAEEHGGDFRRWPAPLRDPRGRAVADVRRRRRARIAFHAWLQWLLDRQLASASTPLPLIADMPIGVDAGGADVWADRELFMTGFGVGAPPDTFNRLGQDWAQPPWNPWVLRSRGYQPLVEILRAALNHTMGLRIDHVMGLFRLFAIPAGGAPEDGVYIRFPAGDMLDILALESVRAGAVIVGEDLGTVEPAVREEMAARDILSYRLLWFEEGAPCTLPAAAMSAVTTHDLPTIAGLWTGADLAAQRAIGVPVNEEGTQAMRARLARVAAGESGEVDDVIASAYAALAGSPSALVAAALEDAAAVEERPNMPGTTGERWPNWRLGLPRPLDDVLGSDLAGRVAVALRTR